MLTTESFDTDILVIGSGIAGMMAAIEARRGGAAVTLASKAALGKESSTSYARSFRTEPGVEADASRIPGYDNKLGKHIEDWRLIRTLAEVAPRQIENLISLGVPMVTSSSNEAFDRVPAWRPVGTENTHGGAIVLDTLAPVVRRMGILVAEGCSMVNLIRSEGRVFGASGLLRDGSWLSIRAKAVVLATGGAAGMAEITSTSRAIAGTGYAMALMAGLQLKNMEFNQIYPVGLPTLAGDYVHCAPLTLMMKNARLKNDEGEDIVKKHFGISLQEAVPHFSIRFDWLPRAVAAELEGGKVWLDLTGVPDEEWEALPERNWKQVRRTTVDMRKSPVPIMPMSHASRSGLIVDTGMRTALEGLYAAGEVVAGWRYGEIGPGNLPSCLAMGAIAGRNAVAGIEAVKAAGDRAGDDGLRQAQAILAGEGESRPEDICASIGHIVYRHHSSIKNGASLEEGLRELNTLEDRTGEFGCRSAADLSRALDATAMFMVGKAMLRASLLRTESRGSFYRRDFPTRDDERWLRPILVSRDARSGEVKVGAGEKVTY